jgi:hypothetical protein
MNTALTVLIVRENAVTLVHYVAAQLVVYCAHHSQSVSPFMHRLSSGIKSVKNEQACLGAKGLSE